MKNTENDGVIRPRGPGPMLFLEETSLFSISRGPVVHSFVEERGSQVRDPLTVSHTRDAWLLRVASARPCETT